MKMLWGRRVMLAASDRPEQREIGRFLSRSGMVVTRARDHVELCLKLITWHPDVVLLDSDAPWTAMTGLAGIIRRSARTPVPIIVTSENLEQEPLRGDAVVNPVASNELLVVVRRVLEGKLRETATPSVNRRGGDPC